MGITIDCDLRHLFGPARDQGPRPTCMAFAASDTHTAVRSGWELLSCEYAYYHALQYDNGAPGDGTTLSGMGVTLILTLDSLSPFAEGDDVPRQRHRPFVR